MSFCTSVRALTGIILLSPIILVSLALPIHANVSCHITDGRKPDVKVRLKQTADEFRTGDRIVIEWHASHAMSANCQNPLFLVLSTPMRTRFEGVQFLAVPPNAPSPYGIKYQIANTRIFIPLHLTPQANQGAVTVKVYEAGPLTLDWALLEVPARIASPRVREDLAIGQDVATASTAVGRGVTILGGNPNIVVRDRFSTDTPASIVRSNSGEFELQVFADYYRVLDANTGELIQERAGRDPNFSPSSRFLGAYATGPGFEIIDLYAGTVITSNDVLHRERGFHGNVHLAAWSPGDTFFALSLNEWGGTELQQALVDGSQHSYPNVACHYCDGIQYALRVDSEAGIVYFQHDADKGWESLFDPSIGTEAARKRALALIPEQAWEESARLEFQTKLAARYKEISDRREMLQNQFSSEMLAALERACFCRPDEVLASIDPEQSPAHIDENWRFPDPIRLSHLCRMGPDGKCVGRLVDWQAGLTDVEDRNALLAKLLVMHKVSTPSTGTPADKPSVQLADARLIRVRAAVERTNEQEKASTPIETLWDRLGQLLADADGRLVLKPISQGTRITVTDAGPLAASIAKASPQAGRFFRRSGKTQFVEAEDIAKEPFYGLENDAQVIDPRSIKEHADWRIGREAYWLIHCFFDYGESSRNWLFLMRASGTGAARLTDFTHRLRYRVGRNPSGLDEHGKIEVTQEFATTMGFGGWPLSFDTVSIAFDRYLIASGLWTIDARRWVLMVDLSKLQVIFFNRDIPEAEDFAQLAVTADGRTLLQKTTNGHLYFYDVASEKLVLKGFDIDDELIVYDTHGYYASSPEGAQFVFLKFAGIPGYNSFHQFARTLKRPDLVRAVLGGKTDTTDPRIGPPPKADLAVAITGSGRDRTATLKLKATSAAGLSGVRLFVDGRQIEELALAGASAERDVAIKLNPEARWATAVAIDASGYESVAVGRELPGPSDSSASRLFVISIGTDHYPDVAPICGGNRQSSCDLALARADAENFVKAVKSAQGALYGHVEATIFLDARGLRTELPSKIKEITAKAGKNDTIMFFAAGHGFRDEQTGKFFLATRETRLESLVATSVGWDELAAAFDGSAARVIVFLDACHSGAAAGGGSNDDAVSTFMNKGASTAVIAAAKGRQDSIELEGGGVFTSALVRAITTDRQLTDSNGNGAIELAELYGALKRHVVKATNGEQTPWIARNLMVGETPLF